MTCPTIVFTTRYGPGFAGGIETAVEQLTAELQQRRPGWDIRRVAAFRRANRLNRVPFLADIIAALQLAVKVRNADIVLIGGAEYAWVRLLFRRNRARTLVVWHGTRYGEIPSLSPHMSLAVRIYAALEWQLCFRAFSAERQIAVSPSVVEELRTGYGFVGPVSQIVNALKVPPSLVRSTHVSTTLLRVLWSGTNLFKKGLDIAIGACRLSIAAGIRLQLTVVGLPTDAVPNEDWICNLGRVSHERVIALLNASDIFLATTRYEGCSMACIEALACGVPIIGTPIVAWMIGAAGACCSTYEAQDVSTLINRYARDSSALQAAREATADVIGQFNWDDYVQAYLNLIETTIRSTASSV